jgi:Icc-related predicted phosphoesterase
MRSILKAPGTRAEAFMKILAISDNVLPQMEDADNLRRVYGAAEAVVSCGDLPAAYVEYITSTLNVPLFFVRGNHDTQYTGEHPGGVNLHGRMVRFRGLTLAGLEGCIVYNRGPIQYTESEMLFRVLGLAPRIVLSRMVSRKRLDIMVTHSPPRDIHDLPDMAHRGYKAFHTMLRLYQPRYMLHGHVDTHDSRRRWRSVFAGSDIININPVKLLDL